LDDFTTPGQWEAHLDPILTGEAITIVSLSWLLIAGQPSPSTGLTYVIDDVPI
jgi:hypothetical protein